MSWAGLGLDDMRGRSSILLVGDSDQDLRIHAATLRDRGFDIVTAHDESEVMVVLDHQTPDLLLVEAGMIDGQGYEICRRVKTHNKMVNVPVVFVTESRATEVIDRIYEVGGVDFIFKPCPLSEFRARIETHLRLHNLLVQVEALQALAIDANPLTHLPGNNTIILTIQEAIENNSDMALIYTDLDNFKSYNDAYGFNAGDDILIFCASTLQDVMHLVCGEEGFLGHIGGDDFVLMVPAEKLMEMGESIVQAFDEGVPEFYTEEGRQRGSILAEDRSGGLCTFSLVAISLAGICLKDNNFTRYVEVAAACVELKKAAKACPGSNLFVDRRTVSITK